MPAGAGQAKAGEVSQAGAVTQQAPIIGLRTLLEFVAWLVATTLQDGTITPVKGKVQAGISQPGSSNRRGAAFLTEELGSVGVAVRRMQVTMPDLTRIYDYGTVCVAASFAPASSSLFACIHLAEASDRAIVLLVCLAFC